MTQPRPAPLQTTSSWVTSSQAKAAVASAMTASEHALREFASQTRVDPHRLQEPMTL